LEARAQGKRRKDVFHTHGWGDPIAQLPSVNVSALSRCLLVRSIITHNPFQPKGRAKKKEGKMRTKKSTGKWAEKFLSLWKEKKRKWSGKWIEKAREPEWRESFKNGTISDYDLKCVIF
jgi:hypothetical protein